MSNLDGDWEGMEEINKPKLVIGVTHLGDTYLHLVG